jgi:branched-chain amino acid transport system ATP-binding protein
MALMSHYAKVFSLWDRRASCIAMKRWSCSPRSACTHHAERACSELAYGDVKRVELAMALANDPKLLLMDEPTAGHGALKNATT